MVHFLLRWPASVALFAVALAAQAQTAPSGARPDPLDPKATVPALAYESSLGQFRRLADDKPISWRAANDNVARIGGWRAYAREAQQPDAVPPAKPTQPLPPVDTARPMPPGHGGHKTQ